MGNGVTVRIAVTSYPQSGYTDFGYDFQSLARLVQEAGGPDLIVVTEAEGWSADNSVVLHRACSELDRAVRRPYVGALGCGDQGGAGPVLLWDPFVLRKREWAGADRPDLPLYGRNQAVMEVRDREGMGGRFRVLARRYSPLSGGQRLQQAEHDVVWARPGVEPTVFLGDAGGTASGPHLPQVDWENAQAADRPRQAVRDRRGRWSTDTRALDTLIGCWRQGTRTGGAGWQAACELDGVSDADRFAPRWPESLLTDWMLINPAMASWFVPDSYRVHRTSAVGRPKAILSMTTATLHVPDRQHVQE